ncbi:DNA polymerase/3'-5' exonuclease PolX [Hufsiella ginkgonis]|uniref:DNA polymerase/3'-5' exonuclease PolX n=1 Tax=Hufsiella ginkgonis TaxID=2695274 RepID=A0A7K1XX23_9SPHI|nr:DNA polymerase/3'-5' exonuclease PolX [Hufsiella ginkgonis]MXV15387.1 DNA polymerase/3'-5' exonuclease PolX [Hufsiella ginkgonis]
MDNKTISRRLKLLGQLMELHDENPFKVRSVMNASFKIDKLPFQAAGKPLAELEKIDGIGKSTAAKVWELLDTQTLAELEGFIAKTPSGVIEIMSVKGLGPKKASVIWKTLGIEDLGELLYACNENRLIEAKGFGSKTQEEIIKAIEFKLAGSGKFLYAHLVLLAEQLLADIKTCTGDAPVIITGEFRRRCEIINSLDFLVCDKPASSFEPITDRLTVIGRTGDKITAEANNGLKVNIHFCAAAEMGWELIHHTGNESHVSSLKDLLAGKDLLTYTEPEIYEMAGLSYIEPELREGFNELELARENKLPELLTYNDLKGTLHNHSTWSDGVNTLEEMALYCRDVLNLEYLGNCDHSKSAVYAKGLSEERVIAQHAEIDLLNHKLAPFKIFKGIESDILSDGSLDYPDEILATFDFVVASIHSAFKMTEERAAERLVKAIENPYTTILGHPTGRLLLSRSGYPVDFRKIIDACAANGVVIEINANPLRLDMDWRWHRYATDKGVLLSVNPDAHRTEGFHDMHYGVLVARKGGLAAANCLNTFSMEEISRFFDQRKVRSSNNT